MLFRPWSAEAGKPARQGPGPLAHGNDSQRLSRFAWHVLILSQIKSHAPAAVVHFALLPHLSRAGALHPIIAPRVRALHAPPLLFYSTYPGFSPHGPKTCSLACKGMRRILSTVFFYSIPHNPTSIWKIDGYFRCLFVNNIHR